MPPFVSVYVTSPSMDAAKALARSLLEDELIACANAFPVESLYTWEGEIQEDGEVAMLMKTRRDLADAVVDAVEDRHSYDTPCAVAFDLEAGSPAYFEWIRSVTGGIPEP